MKKEITIGDRKITYNLRKSKRARNMRLTIYCDGILSATMPERLDEYLVEKFIRDKSGWILEKINFFLSSKWKKGGRLFLKSSKKEYRDNKEKARIFVESRLGHFNIFYGFDWKKISIRRQKTRWGSCSRKGNLNFNYKIMFLPEKFADYIIVHELCHLGEFNHSKNFWNLVEKTIPDHREIVREIRGL